jgi:hypothetical protein
MTLLEIEQRRSRRAQRSHSKETKRQREQRLKQAKAKRLRLRQRLAEDDDAVLTFKEWCALNAFSERQGRRILKGPNGPVVTMLSDKRIGVSRRNNRAWQQSRARS